MGFAHTFSHQAAVAFESGHLELSTFFYFMNGEHMTVGSHKAMTLFELKHFVNLT